MFLKQSTSVTVVLGPFVDSTDGVTAETGLTISQADVRLSKNAGTYAQKSDTGSCTHMENGYYSCGLNTTDTNTLGHLRISVAESGALPVWVDFLILPANVYDSLLSTDKLQVHAVEMQQVEGVKDDAVGLPPQCRLKCLEVGSAVAVLHYGFAINDCRFAPELGSSADDCGIAVAPVIAVAAERSHLAALNHQLSAVAIVFDFVNPVLAVWGVFD